MFLLVGAVSMSKTSSKSLVFLHLLPNIVLPTSMIAELDSLIESPFPDRLATVL